MGCHGDNKGSLGLGCADQGRRDGNRHRSIVVVALKEGHWSLVVVALKEGHRAAGP